MNEGVIKFQCKLIEQTPDFISDEELSRINYWRNILIQKKYLGVNADGLGYGNISIRYQNSDKFIITGSQTGKYATLHKEHLALVAKTSLLKNSLECTGLISASSESLTHAVFYQHCKEINAVIHIHSLELWNEYLNKLPTSDVNGTYGSIELVNSMVELLKTEGQLPVIVMGGHTEGLIFSGKSLDETATNIFAYEQ